MSAIKQKDTEPEVLLRKALWRAGLRFRKNYRGLPGKPDIVFTKAKINELKKELCKKIMESENPFDISCTDWDGGYLVEESDLLEHKLTLKEKFEIEKKTGTVFDNDMK